jgi:putative heme iron utilization protein
MSSDAHGRPSAAPQTFTDSDVRAPSHAERARTLVSGQSTGVLSTVSGTHGEAQPAATAGYPYGSFLTFALDAGQPVFLISRIAEHTRNLAADPRASLLVHETGKADPLANGRVTLLGRGRKLERPAASAREAFLSAHAQASYYVDYADFDFWTLDVEAVRYIGGYGRMSWVEAETFLRASPDPLAAGAAGILAHMNADHQDALLLYARAFTRAQAVESALMTAVDRYGFELTITTPEGIGPARIAFPKVLASAGEARTALIELKRGAELKLRAN